VRRGAEGGQIRIPMSSAKALLWRHRQQVWVTVRLWILTKSFWLPYTIRPLVISPPVISSRSFRPLVISYPVISSPGHLVPWSFRPLLSHHPIQFHTCKIIQFHMCKIILKMWYVVTSHVYHNLRSPISLYSNYIYSDTCVTIVTLHTGVTHVTIVTWHTTSHLSYNIESLQ
jgi:hypothetical protein